MKIAIVNSGGANISSISFALKRLGQSSIFTSDIKDIENADKVILPGVGSAGYAMNFLDDKGLILSLKSLKQPVLGICLGMQILFDYSQEDNTDCLGIIPGEIVKIPNKKDCPVPHMGWNTIEKVNNDNIANILLKNLPSNPFVYFVHSFYAPVSKYCKAYAQYSEKIGAIVNKDNFYGCQFHPEKSGEVGAQILKNFLEL